MIRKSDEMTQFRGRSQFILEQGKDIEQFRKQVMDVANDTRARFDDVGKFITKVGMNAGGAFKGSDELLKFVDQMNKLSLLSGASGSELQSVLTQMPQALAANTLQGDELRSIRENAPLIGKTILDYAHQVMGLRGSLKDLGSDGKLTSRVIVDSLMWASDKTNGIFKDLPMTFSQRWSMAMNIVSNQMTRFYDMMSQISNAQAGQKVLNDIAQSISDIGVTIGSVLTVGISFAEWLSSIGALAPLITYTTTALMAGIAIWGTYQAAVLLASGAMALYGAVTDSVVLAGILSMIKFIPQLVFSFQTLGIAETYAGLSGLEMWAAILLPVAVVIGAIALATAAVNHFAGTSFSALGIIAGLFAWLAMQVYNNFVFIERIFINIAEFWINVWKNPLQSVKNMFADTWNDIITNVAARINDIIGMLNKLPHVNISFVNAADYIAQKSYTDKMTDLSKYKMDFASGWQYDAYNLGAGLPESIKNALTPDLGKLPPMKGLGGDYGNKDFNNNLLDNVKAIRGHTRKIADKPESLEELRQLSEQMILNRYTMLDINFGDVNLSGSTDVDKERLARMASDAVYNRIANDLSTVNNIGLE